MTSELKPNQEHELKIWPEFFEAVMNGSKTFEIRKDDRGFSVGDSLWFREFDPKSNSYTGREMRWEHSISYIVKGAWGLPEDVAVLAVAQRPSTGEVELVGKEKIRELADKAGLGWAIYVRRLHALINRQPTPPPCPEPCKACKGKGGWNCDCKVAPCRHQNGWVKCTYCKPTPPPCPHGCVGGWIQGKDGWGSVIDVPCPSCRPTPSSKEAKP